jgi:hypothetical protein
VLSVLWANPLNFHFKQLLAMNALQVVRNQLQDKLRALYAMLVHTVAPLEPPLALHALLVLLNQI